MYEYIKGKIVEVSLNFIVVENNDIGFKILTSSNSMGDFNKVINTDEKVIVYTHLVVKDDDISLCGFSSKEELEVFRLLISVSGVGVKVGVAILSSNNYKAICSAIIDSNIALLTSASGVGKKTAQRIILELKDKVKKLGFNINENVKTDAVVLAVDSDIIDDAMLALVSLGYTKNEVKKVLNKINISGKTTEDLIKEMLKLINSSK